MSERNEIAAAHEALGEFVIVFQWVESQYREIGWFILDPFRAKWPPMQLRKESAAQLIDNVTDLLVALTRQYAFANGPAKAKMMLELKERFHRLRKYRNRLLHSTYIELKGGGEVLGYIRSNPEVGVDPETGELIFDQDDFTAESIHSTIRDYAEDMFHLGQVKIQLIHWHPFQRHGAVAQPSAPADPAASASLRQPGG